MKTGIVYATKTKHSQKIAEAVGDALGTKAENVKNKPKLESVDLLFIAGGIYGGESLPEMLEYVKSLNNREVKKAALLTSCAGKKNRQESVRSILKEKGIEVQDEFICQGSFLFVGVGHPNKEDIKGAVNFASRISKPQL